MNKTLALLSSILIVTLAGCASQVDKVTASGSYKYLDSKENEALTVPPELDSPEFSKDYELPQLGSDADSELVGRNIFVESPSLVIPLVSGSHVQEGDDSAIVWFDQVDDSMPLSEAIWSALTTYLEKQGVPVDSIDKANGTLTTDWFTLQEKAEEESTWYSGWYKGWFDGWCQGWCKEWNPWYEYERETRTRFIFELMVKPHGRTAALKSTLIDYDLLVDEEVKVDFQNIGEFAKRREEVAMLNQVISHYEYGNVVKTSQRLAKIRQGLKMDLGFDADGNSAFVIDERYDIAWSRLLLVLRKLGFNVKDLDKSNGLLFVTYTDDNTSWLKNLFSKREEKLLDYEDYHIEVTKLGDKTAVTFKTEENEPFEPNVVSDLYAPFNEVMSEDDLDI